MRQILIFGAGGLAADVLDIVHRNSLGDIAGLVVDEADHPPQAHGYRVFHWDQLKARTDEFDCINGIGRPHRRRFIEKAEEAGFRFVGLRDPSAIVFPSAVVAEDAVVGAGAIVAAAAHIGRHAFLNRAVLIGHHTRLDSFVSVQAGANIGGHGHLCDETEIGIGATVIDRITVNPRTRIGAGAVVVRDCPPDSTMIGVPARAHANETGQSR